MGNVRTVNLNLSTPPIMPFLQDNQEVLVHTLVSVGETWYEPDFKDPGFEVLSLFFMVLTVIHPINVMMGEIYTHLFIKGVYAT